jgi:glycosyltransferase involved in cell wall biosynthesis
VRILLVNGHGADLAVGGAERYVHDLRDGLERQGHEVTVLSAFPTEADNSRRRRVLHPTDWREDRVRRYRNHAESWAAPAPARLDDVLSEINPELVHTSNLLGIGTGLWERARRRGLPVVHTVHDYGLLCPRTSLVRRDGSACRPHPLLCGLRTRRMARWAPGVHVAIGVSAHVLARHDGFFVPTTDRRVIHSPLAPFPLSSPSAPASRPIRLGFLGALRAEKGVRPLLAAAAGLRQHGLSLAVAGDGPLREEVAATAGIDYRGPLLGEPLRAFMLSCDVGLVPSLWEEPGLTFVGLEWLAAGRPVITSGRGGLAELEPLGGVVRAAPTADGIVGAAAQLADPGRFAALLATIPHIHGDTDVRRWLDEHEAAYGEAVAGAATATVSAGA